MDGTVDCSTHRRRRSSAMKAMIAFLIACTAWCLAGESKAAPSATAELRKIPNLELWVSRTICPAARARRSRSGRTAPPIIGPYVSRGKAYSGAGAINGRPAVWFDGSQNGKDPRSDSGRCSPMPSFSTRVGKGRFPSSWRRGRTSPRPGVSPDRDLDGGRPGGGDKIAGC